MNELRKSIELRIRRFACSHKLLEYVGSVRMYNSLKVTNVYVCRDCGKVIEDRGTKRSVLSVSWGKNGYQFMEKRIINGKELSPVSYTKDELLYRLQHGSVAIISVDLVKELINVSSNLLDEYYARLMKSSKENMALQFHISKIEGILEEYIYKASNESPDMEMQPDSPEYLDMSEYLGFFNSMFTMLREKKQVVMIERDAQIFKRILKAVFSSKYVKTDYTFTELEDKRIQISYKK